MYATMWRFHIPRHIPRRCWLLPAVLMLGLGLSRPSLAQDLSIWEPVIARLAADGLERNRLVPFFAAVSYDPSIMARKVDSMVRKTFEPPRKPSRRTLERSAYRQFLSPAVIGKAVAFIRENRPAFDRAERDFGPPPELITAIMLVETKLGDYLGEQNALQVLASLARSSDISLIQPFMKSINGATERLAYAESAARDRAEWGYRELLALLRYAAANGQSPSAIPGSIYGAIGICQFMPSNVLTYGVSAQGNGRVDVFSPSDAILSVANYLRGHGWHPGMTADEAKAVVYAYNHSDLYVLAVLTVASRIRDRLQAS